MEVPKPTFEDQIKKTKDIELKSANSEEFKIEFNLMSNTISIQAKKKLSINDPIYFLSLDLKKFQDYHKFFLQFSDVDELFELINDMIEEEFLLKLENESLNLILKIEQR